MHFRRQQGWLSHSRWFTPGAMGTLGAGLGPATATGANSTRSPMRIPIAPGRAIGGSSGGGGRGRQPLQRYLTAAQRPGCTPKTLTVHPGGVQLAGAPSQCQQQGCQLPSAAVRPSAQPRKSIRARRRQSAGGRGFFFIAGNDMIIVLLGVYINPRCNLAMQQPSWTSQKCARRANGQPVPYSRRPLLLLLQRATQTRHRYGSGHRCGRTSCCHRMRRLHRLA